MEDKLIEAIESLLAEYDINFKIKFKNDAPYWVLDNDYKNIIALTLIADKGFSVYISRNKIVKTFSIKDYVSFLKWLANQITTLNEKYIFLKPGQLLEDVNGNVYEVETNDYTKIGDTVSDSLILNSALISEIKDEEKRNKIIDLIEQYGEHEIVEQLLMGVEVEKEHTDDEIEALNIAVDHLIEIKDYYTRLLKMEDEAKQDLNLEESKIRQDYIVANKSGAYITNLSLDELRKNGIKISNTFSIQDFLDYKEGKFPDNKRGNIILYTISKNYRDLDDFSRLGPKLEDNT